MAWACRHGVLPPSLSMALAGLLASCTAGVDPDARHADAGTPVRDGGQADGGPDGELDGDASLPSLEVGAGEHGFEPLEDGDPLVLYMGFQGGWHVFPGARASGIPPEGAVLSYALRDPETGEVQTFPREITLTDDRVLSDEDGWERFGDALIITGRDTDVLGRVLALVATLSPPDGGPPLEDTRRVTIVEPP